MFERRVLSFCMWQFFLLDKRIAGDSAASILHGGCHLGSGEGIGKRRSHFLGSVSDDLTHEFGSRAMASAGNFDRPPFDGCTYRPMHPLDTCTDPPSLPGRVRARSPVPAASSRATARVPL